MSDQGQVACDRLSGDEHVVGRSGVRGGKRGTETGKLNPHVVRVLAEEGIDISGKKTQGVFDLYKAGKRYDYVITVCSKEAADRCPIFPGVTLTEKLHWPFPDTASFTGTDDEVMARVREVRDAIKEKVREFARQAVRLA